MMLDNSSISIEEKNVILTTVDKDVKVMVIPGIYLKDKLKKDLFERGGEAEICVSS